MSHSALSAGISIALLWDWTTTLSLVFGGCCSNAITLEQLTSQYPHAGTLITFFQFLLISLVGLPYHITFWPSKDDRKPITENEAEEQLIQGAVKRISTSLNSHSSAPLRVALICPQEAGRLETFSTALKGALRTEMGHDNVAFTSGQSTPVGTEMDSSVLTLTDSEIASTVHEHESVSVILTEMTPESAATPSDIAVHIVDSSTAISFPQPRHDAPTRIIADISAFSLVTLKPDQPHVFETFAPPTQSILMSWIAPIYWRLSALPFPRLKSRNLPLELYFLQITLFYVISRLNNAAFGYDVPMSVHIIFRSGGLVVSMFLGWLVVGKRYNALQIFSVLLVTLGVATTTFSASNTKLTLKGGLDAQFDSYSIGIILMSLALLLSGFLGLVQDRTFAAYTERSKDGRAGTRPPWQESMFLLHFLSLPMFWSVRHDLATQLNTIHTGPKVRLDLSDYLDFYPLVTRKRSLVPTSFSVPAAYIPLFLNTITQLFCVSGVHQLTTRVSSLTVTLVLVVRKAMSLVISVLFLNTKEGQRQNPLMWFGAGLVLLGTIGYSLGSSHGKKAKKQKQE